MTQNGQKTMITAGCLWAWGLRERLCPCSLPMEVLVYKRLVPGNQSPGSETSPPPFTQAWPGRRSLASCPGSLARLPGGLLTSSGYLSSWHFAVLVLGLWNCPYPWAGQAPRDLQPPSWFSISCHGFLAPNKGWAATRSLPRSPHAHMYVSMCVTCSPWSSPKWNFRKIPVLGKIYISDSSFLFEMNKKWEFEIFLKTVTLLHA